MQRRTIVILLPLALFWTEACQNMGELNPIALHDRPSSLERTCLADDGSTFRDEVQAMYPASVDILVVVDNSASMAAEQAMLRDAFPGLIMALLTGQEPISDLHIGIISTDMGTGGYSVETCSDPVDGDDGILQNTPNPLVPSCASSYGTYLAYDEPTPNPTAIATMSTDFGCIATLGTDGCGFEQHFNSVRQGARRHATCPSLSIASFSISASGSAVLRVTVKQRQGAAN